MNNLKAGQLAANKELFGENSRYAVAPVVSRFGGGSWFVWDSERVNPPFQMPQVIRQAATKEEAVRGL